MISCRNLTKRFGEFTAVDRFTLEVAKGAICAVLGPNGAGKSTTVKMLSGLLAPTFGEAAVCGLNVAANSLAIKRKSGILPENLGLFEDLTIEEHLLLTGQVCGVSPGVTGFLTSHILPVAERIASQVVILRNGRIVWNSAAEGLSRPLEGLYFELAEPSVGGCGADCRASPCR